MTDPTLRQIVDQMTDYIYEGEDAEVLRYWIRHWPRIKAALLESEWQPIETAPRDGTIFDAWLCDCNESDRQFYCTGETRRSAGWYWNNGKFRPHVGLPGMTTFIQPTHWRPLPDPPTEGDG